MANLCSWEKSIVIFSCLLFPIVKNEISRNLALHINPNCKDYPECNSSDIIIFYIEAIGPNDTLHYLWSTRGIPSALIIQTNLNTELKINWTNFLSPNPHHAISFSEAPLYSFGILITKLLQYVDTDDTGSMSNYISEAMEFSDINWTTSNKILNQSSQCSVTFKTNSNSTEFLDGGSFYFQLTAFGDSNRGDKLPRLLHNSNNNEIGIILDHLKTNNSHSRFALEFIAVYNAKEENSTLHMKESGDLDDEYTPGVFSAVKLLTSSSNCSDLCNGYLFWKPIAYTDTSSTVAPSTDVKIYNIKPTESVPSDNIISAYFEFDKTVKTLTWNVSFGMQKDEFYRKRKYTSWYFTVGLGIPPEDSPSLTLILTIAIGFGAPFVCMIGGGIYMAVRKLFKKEDDLLLSHESM